MIGTKFAERYRIERLLGRSASSVVYRALDVSTGNTVTVKLLNDVMNDQETLQRFQREAQVAKTLMHPNLVALLDHGVSADGTPFHVLEFVEGETLDDILSVVGSLNPVESVAIFGKTCRAVQYLHSRGIVHRDLKPGNLMIIGKTAPLAVKVIDYGIAKGTKPGAHESVDVTKAGEVVGSLLYTAPERLGGGQADVRCDIYSLGCLMYETLTGKNPFSADSPQKIVEHQLKHIPEPLTQAGLHPQVAELLQPIVARALEKSPGARFQTAAELKDALDRVEGSVKFAWGTLTEQAKRSAQGRNRRFSKALGVAVLVVIVSALIWALFVLLQLSKFGTVRLHF